MRLQRFLGREDDLGIIDQLAEERYANRLCRTYSGQSLFFSASHAIEGGSRLADARGGRLSGSVMERRA